MAKKGATPNFPPLCSIEQNDSLTLLGVTLQKDCKFSSHVKRKKLREATGSPHNLPCKRLLFHSNCTRFTVCLTYSDILLSMFINQC